MATSWTQLANQPPYPIWYTQLLLDGRVLAFECVVAGTAAKRCCTLTPDINGSYVNGTWTSVASMNNNRLVFTTFILNDGRVIAQGGEFNSAGYNNGEIYDPVANTWTVITPTLSTSLCVMANGPAALLPDGRVLIGSADSGQSTFYAFDPNTTTWIRMADSVKGPPSDNQMVPTQQDQIFNLSVFSHQNELSSYDPVTNTWFIKSNTSVALAGSDGMGGMPILHDGFVVGIGETGNAAKYNPATDTWTTLTAPGGSLVSSNSPAITMPNGKALFNIGTLFTTGGAVYSHSDQFWEYNPLTSTFARVTNGSEPASSAGRTGTGAAMLALPNGQILYTEAEVLSGVTERREFVYNPDPGVGSDSWRPTIISPPATLFRGNTITLTIQQMCGLTVGGVMGNDGNFWTNYPIARLTDPATGHVYYCRTGNLSTRSIKPGTVGSCTMFVPASVPVGGYNLEVIANGVPSFVTSVQVVGAVGSLITDDYQYEFNAFLSGSGTGTFMTKVDGVMSPPDTIQHHNNAGLSRHGVDYGYEQFDARRIPFDFSIDGANGPAAESTYSQFAGAYMMTPAYQSAIGMTPLTGQVIDVPFVMKRPGKAARVAFAHTIRRALVSTGDLAMGLFQGSVELLAGDPRIYSLASHSLATNIPGSATAPLVRGRAANNGTNSIVINTASFNVGPQPTDLMVAFVSSIWDTKSGAPMTVPSGWTRYGSTVVAGGGNTDIFFRTTGAWTTTTFGAGLGGSAICTVDVVAISNGVIDVGAAYRSTNLGGGPSYAMPGLVAAGANDLYVYYFESAAVTAPGITLPGSATLLIALAGPGSTRTAKMASEQLVVSGNTGTRTATATGTGSPFFFSAAGMLFLGQNATSSNILNVSNAGNFPSPRFTITFQGPAQNPTITNTTLGRAIRLNAVLSSSDIVTIDVFNRKIYLNGVSNYGLRRADNQWFDLAPGNNALIFSRSVANGVNCPVGITWQDAWESMA